MKTDWEVKTLGDLFDITSSKRVFESDWQKEGVPFYRAREIVKLAKHGFVNNDLFISEEMYKLYSAKYGIPKEGDIMVTGVGTLGICYVVKKDDKFYFKDGNIIWLKTKNYVNSQYVEYAFKSDYLRKQIDESVGATVGTYTIIKAKNTLIPIPPLSEQQRIVAILDEAFAAIDKAKANAETNLQNARELFESYLQSVFANPGEGWEEVKLSELATDITDGDHMPPPKSESGVPFITISNINKETNTIDFSDTFMVSPEYYKNLKANRKPKRGDVLYTVTGSFGIPVMVEADIEFCFQRHIGLVRPKTHVNSKWLYYLILSPQVFKQGNEGATGTAQRTVSLSVLRNFTVPKVPIEEQQSIVTKLDNLYIQTKQLEAIYQQKLKDLDELKKAILQKAFQGELTSTAVTAMAL